MEQDEEVISIETSGHIIEVSEGCLTINTKPFPDQCISLTIEETEEVLKLLIEHKYGLPVDALINLMK